MKYLGIVVTESLENANILKRFNILKRKRSGNDGWELCQIQIDKGQIKAITKMLKKNEPWYMHFWLNDKIIVAYRERIFEFSFSDKETWNPAVDYGLKLGIPKRQLDFLIDEL